MKSARLLRPLLAAAVFVSGVTSTALVADRGAPARAADTVSRSALSDDFDGARGGAPDGAKWAGDPGRAQLTGDGQLALGTVLRTQKSFGQAYGRAEARIRMNRVGGAWRALGVLNQDGGLPAGKVEVLADDRVDSDDFHTYVIDWTPTSLVWSVDGRQVLRFTPAGSGRPLLVSLNTAAGGFNPATMLVDYVRVSVRVTVKATTWKARTLYRPGKYVRFEGDIYRVRELHTSLPGWQPTLVPALFRKV
ncbi:family 16 glycosylhydrolase [Actinoplanes aureus]|uniref:Family 16 glycosylhydrolase n=1 Tax=Actinoplanes aureus TaxID=2792083 RepID=A0A931C3Z5_9ACTN|nr:family 16 glycosylhydrolase [Actinoplanes aureus]MBG0561784.1 family 16 glycosylhydrolase [Actinoplanes aureus]